MGGRSSIAHTCTAAPERDVRASARPLSHTHTYTKFQGWKVRQNHPRLSPHYYTHRFTKHNPEVSVYQVLDYAWLNRPADRQGEVEGGRGGQNSTQTGTKQLESNLEDNCLKYQRLASMCQCNNFLFVTDIIARILKSSWEGRR